jgi:hypothetical protein
MELQALLWPPEVGGAQIALTLATLPDPVTSNNPGTVKGHRAILVSETAIPKGESKSSKLGEPRGEQRE